MEGGGGEVCKYERECMFKDECGKGGCKDERGVCKDDGRRVVCKSE